MSFQTPSQTIIIKLKYGKVVVCVHKISRHMPHDSSPYIENGLACSSLHGLLSQIGHWRIKLPSLPHSSTHRSLDPQPLGT